MKDFEPIKFRLLESDNIRIEFFDTTQNANLLLVKIYGKILDGSNGSLDCDYISQQVGLALISSTYTAVIIDLTEMDYRFGNSIINAFMPLENIRIGEDRYLKSYVLSDRNKFGLSTLWCFDLESPREPIFYELDDAMKYIEMKYLTE